MTIVSNGGFEQQLAILRDLAANGLSMQSVAVRTEALMVETLDQGVSPEGEVWVKKKDGSRPYKNASKRFSQNIVGRSIVMKMAQPDAWGHWGTGYIKRRGMLPSKGIPMKLGNAIRAGLVDDFRAKTKAGKRGYSHLRARGQKITRSK